MCIWLPAGAGQQDVLGYACRLSKLPPVNPVWELLTLSIVRLAVAIIWTWPGLKGLGLGSNRTSWRGPVCVSKLKSDNPRQAPRSKMSIHIFSLFSLLCFSANFFDLVCYFCYLNVPYYDYTFWIFCYDFYDMLDLFSDTISLYFL